MYAHILGFNISLVKFSLGLKVENLALGPSGTDFKVDMTFLTGINQDQLKYPRSSFASHRAGFSCFLLPGIYVWLRELPEKLSFLLLSNKGEIKTNALSGGDT